MKNLIKNTWVKGYFKIFLKVFTVIMILLIGFAYLIFRTINFMDFESNEELLSETEKFFEREAQDAKIELINLNYQYGQNFGSSERLYNSMHLSYYERPEIVEYYNNPENIKAVKKQLDAIPMLKEIKPYLENKEAIFTEMPKFAYGRRFTKDMALYAKYLALNSEFEKTTQVIEKMVSITLMFSRGSYEKPLLIEYMIATAMHEIINETVKQLINSDFTDFPENMQTEIKLPESTKNKLLKQMNFLEEFFAEINEAVMGEKIVVIKTIDYLYEKYPVNMKMLDIFTMGIFNNTKDKMINFYNQMNDYIEKDRGEHFDDEVGYKYYESSNPIISISTPRLKRIFTKEKEINEKHSQLINLLQ
ncbi:MAG: hypothetical protein ACQESP_07280 [Candidatus Muiribacteriota bacterium]